MTDGTPKLVALRSIKSVPAQEVVDTPVSAYERESFIAETAIKLDQLQASHRVLAREVADLVGRVTKIEEVAGHDHRLHAFQQGQQRAKTESVDEVVRACRDLKARLDRIEARTDGDYHAYNSFEAVSRKLAELDVGKRPRRKLSLLFGALLITASLGSAFELRSLTSEVLNTSVSNFAQP
jgi:hypothetical protein